MSYVPVVFSVIDQNDEPVEGAAVVVLTTDLRSRYLEQTTNADGEVSGLLPDGTYEVRLFYPEARTPPFSLTVPDQAEPYRATLDIEKRSPMDAQEPGMCRVYEMFRTTNGEAQGTVSADLTESLVIRGGTVFVPSQENYPITRGLFAAELPRGAKVLFAIPGSHARVEAVIPDRPSARLTDLMFPYPAQYTVDPSYSSPMALGSTQEILAEATLSDTRTVPLSEIPGQWSVEPATGLTITPTGAGLLVTANEAGSYEITFTPDRPMMVFPEHPAVIRTSTPTLALTLAVLP